MFCYKTLQASTSEAANQPNRTAWSSKHVIRSGENWQWAAFATRRCFSRFFRPTSSPPSLPPFPSHLAACLSLFATLSGREEGAQAQHDDDGHVGHDTTAMACCVFLLGVRMILKYLELFPESVFSRMKQKRGSDESRHNGG